MTIALTISTLATLGTAVNAADVTTPDNENLAHINNILNGAQSAEVMRFDQVVTPSNPASGKNKLYFKSDDGLYKLDSGGVETLIEAAATYPRPLTGRLTLTTATPVTTTDVTAATTVYYTPYNGSEVTLYNGSSWTTYELTELSLSLSGFAANIPRDIFLSYSGGLVLTSVAWSTATARAVGLALQDGVWVQTANAGARYVGTICTTSTIGQCEDSYTNRLVWNYYNRVPRPLFKRDTTDSWTYTTASWRSWNNSTANRVNMVVGLAEDAISFKFMCVMATSSAAGSIGIGVDSTTTPTGLFPLHSITNYTGTIALFEDTVGIGLHYLQMLEYGGTTITFRGDNGGTAMQSGGLGHIAA